jgi:NitT/TauT family transport system permease protein
MAGEMLSATTAGQVLMMGRDLADISQVMAVMLVIVLIVSASTTCLFEYRIPRA